MSLFDCDYKISRLLDNDGSIRDDIETVECPSCSGDGNEECDCTGGCGSSHADSDCFMCSGTGAKRCPCCHGLGVIEEEKW